MNPAINKKPIYGEDKKVDQNHFVDDWYLIEKFYEKSCREDECTEVIEREIANASSNWTNTDNSVVEDIKDNANIEPELFNKMNKHIQTNESPACESCQMISAPNTAAHVTNRIIWKIIYSFALSIFVSLIFHQYEIYTASTLFSSIWRKSDVHDSFIYSDSVDKQTDNLVKQLYTDILEKKNILDEIFSYQHDVLKNVRFLQGDIYILNISALDQKLAVSSSDGKIILDVLTIQNKILLCPADIAKVKLPFVCKTGEHVEVLLEKSQLILLHKNINKLFLDLTHQFSLIYNDIIKLLEKPDLFNKKFAKGTSDDNDMSKHKLNNYVKTNFDCNSTVPVDDFKDPSTVRRPKLSNLADAENSAETQFRRKEATEKFSNNNKQLLEEIKIFFHKFKHAFENLYHLYVKFNETEVKSTPSNVSSSYDTNNSSVKKNTSFSERGSTVPVTHADDSENSSLESKLSSKWYSIWKNTIQQVMKYYKKLISNRRAKKENEIRSQGDTLRKESSSQLNMREVIMMYKIKAEDEELHDFFLDMIDRMINDFSGENHARKKYKKKYIASLMELMVIVEDEKKGF